ncbi:MAG: efflux RND transporter periplasmic adaptor subunit [Gammaproteobacteria bacterium]|nr:efflux RND transporter periplasmic adaptor subunit [Gammaproteobacteria bacterium]MDH5629116.1 efflux RND transporter periplasmic adaptor subunit [Gammaproteobacteria bacterium]
MITSLLLAGCSSEDQRGGKGGNRGGKSATNVAAISPVIQTAAEFYTTTAILEPSSDADIYARTSGVIRAIYHEEGDDVEAGAILLQLEDDDQKLRLEKAEQSLRSSEREYNRLDKMRKSGAVSANDWEAIYNTYHQAKTDKELAELALSYTKVTASFSGRLVKREVDLGAHVLSGTLLFRMMSIKPLLIRVHVPANRIGQVTAGQWVDLQLDSVEQPIKGEISLVSPIVDPDTGTIKVTIKLEDYPQNVRPGDFTQILMVTNSRENALMVPNGALLEERGQYYVYTVTTEEGQSSAKKTQVETGYVSTEMTEIRSGISTSDLIVVKGQRNLSDGDKVAMIDDKIDGKSKIDDKQKQAGDTQQLSN